MLRAVMYDPWQDFSQYDGLTGYGCYWTTRLCYQTPATLARECLFRIVGYIEEQFSDIQANDQTDVYCFLHDFKEIQDFEICTGLLAGYAGEGLLRLTALNKTNISWMNLL